MPHLHRPADTIRAELAVLRARIETLCDSADSDGWPHDEPWVNVSDLRAAMLSGGDPA